MTEYKLKLEKRELTGKKLKNLRKSGLVPSVLYGGKEPILLASEYVATEKILAKAGYHSPIDLNTPDKNQMAIVKNIDVDPVTRRILNVEFKAVSARSEVTTVAPIVIVNFENSEAGKNSHFAITQAINEVEVKAKPKDLPKELTLDASRMTDLEDKLKFADIELPKGVEFANKELDLEQVVASMHDPVAEAAKAEAEEAAEPEESEESKESEEDSDAKDAESTESEKPSEDSEQ